MVMNRFQFEPVKQPRTEPTADPSHFPAEDPRREYGFAHAGYNRIIPMNDKPTFFRHEETGREMSPDQYHSETRMMDRAMDQHYAEPEGED